MTRVPTAHHLLTPPGCAQCKKARVKCDEDLPRCGLCSKKGVHCLYLDLSADEVDAMRRARASVDLMPPHPHPHLQQHLQQQHLQHQPPQLYYDYSAMFPHPAHNVHPLMYPIMGAGIPGASPHTRAYHQFAHQPQAPPPGYGYRAPPPPAPHAQLPGGYMGVLPPAHRLPQSLAQPVLLPRPSPVPIQSDHSRSSSENSLMRTGSSSARMPLNSLLNSDTEVHDRSPLLRSGVPSMLLLASPSSHRPSDAPSLASSVLFSMSSAPSYANTAPLTAALTAPLLPLTAEALEDPPTLPKPIPEESSQSKSRLNFMLN